VLLVFTELLLTALAFLTELALVVPHAPEFSELREVCLHSGLGREEGRREGRIKRKDKKDGEEGR
jgi:hypothetical protein